MTDPTPDPNQRQPIEAADATPHADPSGTPPGRERIEPSPASTRRDPLSLVYLLGFLVLSGALAYLWLNPAVPDVVAEDTSRLDALDRQVRTVSARVDQAEQRPSTQSGADLGPLEARIAAVEARGAPGTSGAPGTPGDAATPASPVDLGPLEARLAALEARGAPASDGSPAPEGAQATATDLRPLEARLAALEARPAPSPPAPVDLRPLEERLAAVEARPVPEPPPAPGTVIDMTQLATRLDGVAARQDALAGRVTAERADMLARIEAFTNRVDGAEKEAGQVTSVAQRTTRLSAVQSATAALEAGQPLGPVPGAPPALARFAEAPPPTASALRLAFPAAAEAAHAASQPAIEADQPLLNRMWTRAQQTVTVRQGDRVLLGDPIAGVLAGAQERLDAGDLAGTLKALAGLSGPAAAAMANWRGRAQALLDARSALVEMAAQR